MIELAGPIELSPAENTVIVLVLIMFFVGPLLLFGRLLFNRLTPRGRRLRHKYRRGGQYFPPILEFSEREADEPHDYESLRAYLIAKGTPVGDAEEIAAINYGLSVRGLDPTQNSK